MKMKKPSDPDALNRLVDHLAKLGWIEKATIVDCAHSTGGSAGVTFTQVGLEYIALLDKFHEGLGDIDERDRHFLYDWLGLISCGSRQRSGEV
jgi:hypothetical protein